MIVRGMFGRLSKRQRKQTLHLALELAREFADVMERREEDERSKPAFHAEGPRKTDPEQRVARKDFLQTRGDVETVVGKRMKRWAIRIARLRFSPEYKQLAHRHGSALVSVEHPIMSFLVDRQTISFMQELVEHVLDAIRSRFDLVNSGLDPRTDFDAARQWNSRDGSSVSAFADRMPRMVAGTGFEPVTFRL